jgi:hypothetical protein
VIPLSAFGKFIGLKHIELTVNKSFIPEPNVLYLIINGSVSHVTATGTSCWIRREGIKVDIFRTTTGIPTGVYPLGVAPLIPAPSTGDYLSSEIPFWFLDSSCQILMETGDANAHIDFHALVFEKP